MSTVDAIVGGNLQQARRARAMAVEEVANLLGVNTFTLRRFEAGMDRVSAEHLQVLCRLYDLPVSAVFTHDAGVARRFG